MINKILKNGKGEKGFVIPKKMDSFHMWHLIKPAHFIIIINGDFSYKLVEVLKSLAKWVRVSNEP
jgi:hypothetical protein